ncbi:hypothetical protein L7F22_034572 [Adiantum nelumboides]|nr:hypothetical protein [Adiantum nelumboides]
MRKRSCLINGDYQYWKKHPRHPINDRLVRQVATSFNKDTNIAIVNNRKLQLTPTIVEHIFKVSNASTPKPCPAEEISQYLQEKREQKQKRKAAGQGVTISDLPKKKAYKFAIEPIGLKNYNTYISEKILSSDSQRPQPPLTITAVGEPELASSNDTDDDEDDNGDEDKDDQAGTARHLGLDDDDGNDQDQPGTGPSSGGTAT